MNPHDYQYVTIADAGRAVADATIRTDPDTGSISASLHVEAGQLPAGTRTRLVDAVLDLPGLRPGTRVEAAVPAGDGEILDRLRQRCNLVLLRSAGASCLVVATVTQLRRRSPG